MARIFLFLFSYGLCISNVSQIILYLNYRTLGHSWQAVLSFIISTPSFYIAVISFIVLISTLYIQTNKVRSMTNY